ncbi:ABC-type glycerol-3-phosphate transport system permease component [Paenibacillus castaneae]|uniref:carbohydrate ABC transporter permease n=1 Tax=Paenibacillus castaneae TaxID=474957 RepID=UPI000C9D1F12|nr:carbohydrate ABC transporter permease [Paenibacillus castaneae]NIK79896.1 ABC-type glycerol-3-phosphate transport system permease component [Paenibacillus castaneae]
MVYGKGPLNRILDGVILIILCGIATLSLFPLLHILAISFSDKSAVAAGSVILWPKGVNLAAYRAVVQDGAFFTAFWVSVKRVLLGGGIQFALTILMAYPLSREVNIFRLRNVYMWFIVFTMLFSGGLIPWYITIRDLGLLDSIWALVLPGAVPVFNVIILMNFFRGIPKELDDAATIDGAGPWRTLLQIYVPLSLPALATVTLFSIVTHWNSFFDGLILMNNPSNQPLQTYLNQIVVQFNNSSANMTVDEIERISKLSNQTVNSAKILVSMIPILIIYPLLQKYFVNGLTLGSVKE